MSFISTFKLGELYVRYYQLVKQSRDFDYKYSCDEAELRDIEHAVLYLLNHLATDCEQNPIGEEHIKNQLIELVPNELQSETSKDLLEIPISQ